jgi:hypothetical protein
MMSAEECRAHSAIWLARGKNQNISFKRAMTFLDLARSWNLLATWCGVQPPAPLRGYSIVRHCRKW